jgi:putative membrane protein
VTTVVWLVLAAAAGLQLVGVARSRVPWPPVRTVCWLAGLGCVGVALAGPFAHAHADLHAHMAAHLLLGMVGPLLLVLARPGTLWLRALPAPTARQVSGVLRSAPVRLVTDPFVATGLNLAGLWLLYRTGLLAEVLHSPGLHLAVSAHVLLTGWLATAAVLALDPLAHRRGVGARAAALAVGMAGHDVLAKTLYADPPAGVVGAEAGARLMYDGGTVVHLLVAAVLWRQWYRSRAAVRDAEQATQPAPA